MNVGDYPYMRSIHDERELRTILEDVYGPLSPAQEALFAKAMAKHNDPRRGYMHIKTVNDALYWLWKGEYEIASFSGGLLGISNKVSGGCWGYFADGVIDQLKDKGYIQRGGLNNNYRITLAGQRAGALVPQRRL